EEIESDVELRPGPRLQTRGSTAFARQVAQPRDRAAVEIRAHVVRVEKQVKRKQSEDARYTRRAQPAAHAPPGEQFVDQFVGERLNVSRWFLRLCRDGFQPVAVYFGSFNQCLIRHFKLNHREDMLRAGALEITLRATDVPVNLPFQLFY